MTSSSELASLASASRRDEQQQPHEQQQDNKQDESTASIASIRTTTERPLAQLVPLSTSPRLSPLTSPPPPPPPPPATTSSGASSLHARISPSRPPPPLRPSVATSVAVEVEPESQSHVPSQSVSCSSASSTSQMFCQFCFDFYAPDQMVTLNSCRHSLCTDCMQSFARAKFESGHVLHVLCPQPQCGRVLQSEELRPHLTPQHRQQYDRLLINALASLDPTARWCSTPDCDTVLHGSRSRPHLICPVCKGESCFTCREPWHPGVACRKSNRPAALVDYMRNNDVKPCPRCSCLIERTEGCNHMTCSQCSYEFCWICGGKYTSLHFAVWNIAGCPGLQGGFWAFAGDDDCFGLRCDLGCGFAGIFKRCVLRLALVFSILLLFPIVCAAAALFALVIILHAFVRLADMLQRGTRSALHRVRSRIFGGAGGDEDVNASPTVPSPQSANNDIDLAAAATDQMQRRSLSVGRADVPPRGLGRGGSGGDSNNKSPQRAASSPAHVVVDMRDRSPVGRHAGCDGDGEGDGDGDGDGDAYNKSSLADAHLICINGDLCADDNGGDAAADDDDDAEEDVIDAVDVSVAPSIESSTATMMTRTCIDGSSFTAATIATATASATATAYGVSTCAISATPAIDMNSYHTHLHHLHLHHHEHHIAHMHLDEPRGTAAVVVVGASAPSDVV